MAQPGFCEDDEFSGQRILFLDFLSNFAARLDWTPDGVHPKTSNVWRKNYSLSSGKLWLVISRLSLQLDDVKTLLAMASIKLNECFTSQIYEPIFGHLLG